MDTAHTARHLRVPGEPVVAIIHPDELVLDCIQYALEQVGIAARALVPAARGDFAALAPFLPTPLLVCVCGLNPADSTTMSLLHHLQAERPEAQVVVLTTTPPVQALGTDSGAGATVLTEGRDIETTVAAVVQAVRICLTTNGHAGKAP